MIQALFLTIVVGLFFLAGIFITNFIHNKNKLLEMTTGLTFIIMLYLILFDLIPEINELLNPLEFPKYILLIIIFVLLGITLLKLLDLFVPEHTHKHQENETNIEEHNNHFFHIGFITAISLIIHNILEGISIYITGLNNFSAGILMAITVGIHNLPLGIEISASMNMGENKKKFNFLVSILLTLSSCFGAFFLFLFHTDFNTLLEGILLSITLGMLIYISVFELLPEVMENKKRKYMQIGLIVGLIIAILLGCL